MKSRAPGSVVRLAAPLRALAQRFSFFLLTFAALALMMVGKVDPVLVETLRSRVADAFAPILEAMSRPAASAASVIDTTQNLLYLKSENERLQRENATLLQWQQAALRLEAENKSLRGLLNFVPDPNATFVTARVIADPGGAYVRTVVVTAGARNGVRRGQAAVTGQGVIGRVVEVGEWSSRVLLITDLNMRLPVVVEPSHQRAVLGGDNSDRPKLMYMPPDAPISVGDRVVTSGHAGVLPPGLPVGVVASVGERGIRVQPVEDLGRIEHVQLVDFGAPGGLAAEMSGRENP